jgi:hypothetical protein
MLVVCDVICATVTRPPKVEQASGHNRLPPGSTHGARQARVLDGVRDPDRLKGTRARAS